MYVSPLMGLRVYVCVGMCWCGVKCINAHWCSRSLSDPQQGKNFHSSFPHAGKFAEIWPMCEFWLKEDPVRIRVSTTSTFTARRSWVSNTRLGPAFDVEPSCSTIGLWFHTASKHVQLLAWLLQAGCPVLLIIRLGYAKSRNPPRGWIKCILPSLKVFPPLGTVNKDFLWWWL